MKIEDFFDPKKTDHIQAFYDLRVNGSWPEGFVPEGTDFSNPYWIVNINEKMANCWINQVLTEKNRCEME